MAITSHLSARASRGWTVALALLLGAALSIAGCASAGGATTGGVTTSAAPTATASGPAPTATPHPAPPHAFAWYQYDSHHSPQIWASVNGATPRQITHIGPPPTDGCDNQLAWSPPVFSPDLTHIVAALGGYGCGDGYLLGPVSVIDASTGAMATVPGNENIRLSVRAAGWLDASTIWFVSTTENIYTYHLGAGSATALPGIAGAVEAATRGATLFWESVDTSTSAWSYTLHRYDLGAHSALAGTVSLGAWRACQCSPGDFLTPGWDASPDGAHLVYQSVTPSSSVSGGIAGSHIYYSAADGSGASQIARYMVTNSLVRAQISPDGQWVAFTTALPSPATLTASVSSPGGAGDSTFHGYSPDTYDYPVWKWDSSQFWAAKTANGTGDFTPTSGGLYRFTLGAGSALGVAGGYNPWYTIGG